MDQGDINTRPVVENQTIPRVLARNSACHQCRKRKLKCDATRPICTNCAKPRPRIDPHGETQCTWDDKTTPPADQTVAGPSKSKKRKDDEDLSTKKARLQELEERVAAFEKQLKAKQSGRTTSPPIVDAGKVAQDVPLVDPFATPAPMTDAYGMWNDTSSNLANGFVDFTAVQPIPSLNCRMVQQDMTSNPTADLPYSNQNSIDNVFDLIWPDWPQDLPSLEVVQHVVNVFFDKVPTAPRMLHRATFLHSLQLPPSNFGFPARALLHGILGLTAPHLPSTALATRAYFPTGSSLQDIYHPEHDFEATTGGQYRNLSAAFHFNSMGVSSPTTPMGRFQMWHRRKALQAMSIEFDSGQKLLQAVQAQVMVTLIDAYNAWWTDLWMEAGACVRMAVPLSINETSKHVAERLPRFKHVLIPPAQNSFEQACRDRTWWIIYSTERSVNMSTSWAESLVDSEITVELPVTQAIFDSASGELTGTQTFQSPDLFATHPPIHADGFVLYIKALKLWTDVARFFRSYGRGKHTVAGYLAHPTLRLFMSQINSFRLSIPPHLRRPTQVFPNPDDRRAKTLDVDLISAILISHGITLSLAEPVITRSMFESDIAKMGLSAIRAVLSLLYDITSTSFDFSLLSYSCSYIWFMCGRGLCRFIDAAMLKGDLVAASVYRSECEVFRMAIQQQGERHPISNRHLEMLDDLLKLQQESSPEFETLVHVNCTNDRLFDPNWRPSSDPSQRTSSASVSVVTPPTGSEASPGVGIPGTYITTPAGFAPAHRSGALPNPAKQFWKDEFPSANQAHFVDATSAFSSIPSQDNGQSRSTSVSGGFDFNTTPGSMGSSGNSRPQTAHTGAQSQTESFSGMASTSTFSFEGMDMDQWFDISNLSFDPDTLAALAGVAQGSGEMFDPADHVARV